jgi:hypothetical protein
MNRITTLCLIVSMAAVIGCAARQPLYTIEADRLTIRVELPETEAVLFASSLDDFRLRNAQLVSERVWEIVQPADRTFTYFFMVGGRPYVPKCRLTEADDFGTRNCLFVPGL